MMQWLKKRLNPAQRPDDGSEPVEPPLISNSPGFRVDFVAGKTLPAGPAGLRFHAKLYLWTPLSVLQSHGRLKADGEASRLEAIPPEFGTWRREPVAPVGWEPLEMDEESDVGPVKPSVILPFLKAFRAIAESGQEPLEQARKFNRMHLLNPAWKPFVEALQRPSEIHPEGAPDLASVWFCPHLQADLKGLGPGTAADLYQAGFLTAGQVREAGDADLLKVEGINKSILKRMRQNR